MKLSRNFLESAVTRKLCPFWVDRYGNGTDITDIAHAAKYADTDSRKFYEQYLAELNSRALDIFHSSGLRPSSRPF